MAGGSRKTAARSLTAGMWITWTAIMGMRSQTGFQAYQEMGNQSQSKAWGTGWLRMVRNGGSMGLTVWGDEYV